MMAISRDEIDKYIFDPKNPKQCRSYTLLLRIAKKEDFKSFFSPEFLHYFFQKQIITKEFEDALWDKPNNYNTLNVTDKIKLYKDNLSEEELIEYGEKVKIDVKYNFLYNNTVHINNDFYQAVDYFGELINIDYQSLEKNELEVIVKESLVLTDSDNSLLDDFNSIYKNNYILFSKNYFDILKFNISFSSIFITLESNIDKFLEYDSKNIKPIFLKKIEDVDILLNVLEHDLKKEKHKNLPKNNIESLNEITIKNFFSINKITLTNLKDKKEIYIVGENGDGKTLLLQAIAVGLKGTVEDGLKEFRIREKEFNIEIGNKEDIENNFFAYGSSRNNSCQLNEDSTGYLSLFSREYDLKSPTKWLQYLDYSEQKENDNVITVIEAKKLLNHLLNSEIEIDISPNGVTFKEKDAPVSFKQLSAGYKGVITIICDLIARLSEKQQVENISDFQGVVLIDEVELHLHPKWKYNFMKKLRDTFPLIQFIVTTHSPTVILGASKEAVFYKIYKEDGEVKISNQIANEGYTHNSLISSPLFDLDSITSRDYEKRRVSSDDYVYDKIHQVVSERIKEEVNTSEEDIMKLINEELDKL